MYSTLEEEDRIKTMSRKRNIDLDIYRGIACWLVIWGHTIQCCYAGNLAFFENLVFRFIYGFHMPFFMTISGYLFCETCQKYDLKAVIRKQIQHIVYPLAIWGGVDFLCNLFQKVGEIHTFFDFLKVVYKSYTGPWFLWSVFIISVSVAVAYNVEIVHIRRGIRYVIAFVALILLPTIIEPCKTMNIWMYPYFLAGFLLFAKKDVICQLKSGKKEDIKYILIILYPALLHFFHYRDYIYTSGINLFRSDYGFIEQFQINTYRWVLGYAGIGFMVVLLQLLFKKSYVKDVVFRLFGKLGRVTMQVYILQRILLERIFGRVCKMAGHYGEVNFITKNVYLCNFVITPVIGLVHLIIIYKLIWWIRKFDKLNQYLFGE